MEGALVTVMMPAFNAAQYIGQAIESVVAQSYQNWELIVVNDGSTDGTAAVVAQYKDPRIIVFHRENGGESAARNVALEAMRGNYLAFLDADDVYVPEHLELAIGYLQSHPNHHGVYTDGYYCDSRGRCFERLSTRRRGPFEEDIFDQVALASDVFGPPGCAVLRAGLIQQHRLQFDTNIVIGPDWDFLTRYAALGGFGYIDQPTYLYRIHQTNITVRVDDAKRALSLATCREKTIKLERFAACSTEVRYAVLYDLLVNLLPPFHDRQLAVLDWIQFHELPALQRARLLRLMASRAVVDRELHPNVRHWLRAARTLAPADIRTHLLWIFYILSPRLCRVVLQARRGRTSQSHNPILGFVTREHNPKRTSRVS